MSVSMNGYARIDVVDSRLTRVSVAGHPTYLLGGAVAAVLVELGRRFDAEVEPVQTFNGWRSAALNAASGGISTSNHMSGTAVDINGGKHPRYRHGTFTAAQVAAIRRILAELGGVVRWGGDWNGDGRLTESDTDEMHFEVVASPAAVATVANRIATTGTVPSVPDTHVPDPIEEDDMYTDDDRANAAELRRFNGVLAGALAPGNENEARLVARLKALDSLERILANTDEDRRMLGVILGWQPAQGPEAESLRKLWDTDDVPASLDPTAIARAVVAALGPELAAQVAERLTVTVKS